MARFWARVRWAGANDCWLWTGSTTPDGYGRVNFGYRDELAHRLAYGLLVGPALPTNSSLPSNSAACPAIRRSAAFIGQSPPELDEALGGDLDALDDDLAGRLCVVMVAALGREALDAGRPLTVAQLAALLSWSPDHVRLRAREGQIRLVERDGLLTCSAEDARRLLEAQGAG